MTYPEVGDPIYYDGALIGEIEEVIRDGVEARLKVKVYDTENAIYENLRYGLSPTAFSIQPEETDVVD